MERSFLFIWLFIIIVVVYQSNVNKDKDKDKYKYKEGFTPKIKGFYRPYVRHLRLNVESLANKYNGNFLMSFLRKTGLY